MHTRFRSAAARPALRHRGGLRRSRGRDRGRRGLHPRRPALGRDPAGRPGRLEAGQRPRSSHRSGARCRAAGDRFAHRHAALGLRQVPRPRKLPRFPRRARHGLLGRVRPAYGAALPRPHRPLDHLERAGRVGREPSGQHLGRERRRLLPAAEDRLPGDQGRGPVAPGAHGRPDLLLGLGARPAALPRPAAGCHRRRPRSARPRLLLRRRALSPLLQPEPDAAGAGRGAGFSPKARHPRKRAVGQRDQRAAVERSAGAAVVAARASRSRSRSRPRS